MENQYKPNSHKSRAEEEAQEKEVKPVVSNEVKRKKKSSLQKFANDFISEDIDNVKSYVWSEIILPNVKDIIFNSLRTTFEMFIYGDSDRSHHNGKSRNRQGSRVSYERYYEDSPRGSRERTTRNRNNRMSYNFDDIIFSNYAEADEVLLAMDDLMDRYHIVSVADYYHIANQESNYTDERYGWDDISTAKIVRSRNNGYFIKLPRAERID